jgi:Tol biopolymer transport system component/DNA-binding winged helix-turn-helix (wHTH) protein
MSGRTSGTQPSARVRFGVFEIDPDAGEVRKAGLKIRIQDQPFQVLKALVDRPGEVVTRDDLRQKLWPSDTFVDFDHSLNTAINKLREALGDGAESPRYVETVPKRGYRFIAPVERLGQVEPVEEEPAAIPERKRHDRSRGVFIFVAGVLAGAGLIAAVWGIVRVGRVQREPVLEKFAFVPLEGANSPVISPDGKHIAYVNGAGAQAKLWIQDLDRFEPREVGGSAGVLDFPFWSFDSRQIGFAVNHRLWRAPAAGGDATIVCEFPGHYLGGAWKPDGETIVFTVDHHGLYAVPAGGGTAQLILKPDPTRWNHFEIPRFLRPPYSSLLLMTAQDRTGKHVAVLHSLSSARGEVEVVSQDGRAAYSPTGHLIYPMNTLLWAMPFAPGGAQRPSEPFPIGQATVFSYAPVSVSLDGTLVYQGGQVRWQLRWRDRQGREVDAVRDPAACVFSLALSPEGGKAAVSAWEPNSLTNVFVWDFTRRTRTVIAGTVGALHPIWHPSGRLVAFSSTRRGNRDIYLQETDSTRPATVLVAGPQDEIPLDWSSDGKILLYEVVDPAVGKPEIWYLRQKDGSQGYDAKPFIQSVSRATGAALSPDGRFLAYQSSESGRPEVYVQRFPEGGDRQQVSADGGTCPRWRHDGRELFYVTGDLLMAVAVHTVPAFSAAPAKPLFQEPNLAQLMLASGDGWRVFDPSADGQRFLFAVPDGPAYPQIRVVRNWFAEFRDRPVSH